MVYDGLTLSLVDHSPDEEDTDKAETTPDEEHLTLEIRVTWSVIDHVRCGVSNSPVQQPIACSRHRQRLGSDLQWEDLSRHDPSHRSPAGRKEKDVDADEGDQGLLGGLVCDAGSCADTSDDELADGHADGTEEEKAPSPPSLYAV